MILVLIYTLINCAEQHYATVPVTFLQHMVTITKSQAVTLLLAVTILFNASQKAVTFTTSYEYCTTHTKS